MFSSRNRILVISALLTGLFSNDILGQELAIFDPAERVMQERLQTRMSNLYDAMEDWVSWHSEDERLKTQLSNNQFNTILECVDSVRPPKETSMNALSPIVFGATTSHFIELPTLLKEVDYYSEATLTQALEEREKFLHSAFVGQVLNVIDQELYLSHQQRESIKVHLIQRQPAMSDGLFSLSRLAVTYGKRSISSANLLPMNLLSDSQRFHFQNALEGRMDYGYRSFDSDEDFSESRLYEINFAVKSNAETLANALSMQIDLLKTSRDLKGNDEHRLALAREGAIQRTAVRNTRRIVNYLGDPKQKIVYAGGSTVREVTKEEIWKTAIAKHQDNSAYINRQQQMQDATSQYVVAIIDQELWLSIKQRESLLEVVADAVGSCNESDVRKAETREWYLLWRVLYRLQQKPRQVAFSDRQLEIIKQLLSYFEVIDDTVRIQSLSVGKSKP